jgi:soluble lytic murein transglycosylase
VTRLIAVLAVVAVGAATFAYVDTASPPWYERLRYPLAYGEIIRGHARNYRLEPELIAAVIYQESKFEVDARSEAGAIGLMQLQPQTARGIAVRTGGSAFRVEDLSNPEINVRYGSWYLRHLLDKYGDEELALAAYNAGQTRVDGWRAAGEGIVFAETRAYVRRVAELKAIYREAYASELGY